MSRTILALGLVAGALLSHPAAADKVVRLKSHSDAISMMGQKTPAQDTEQLYWFGPEALRFDDGGTSTVMKADTQQLIFIDHEKKTYATLDLPLDFKKLVGPEMAPMVEQMMKMMAATVQVTPSDRTGKFAGYACAYSKVNISMGMMQMAMDVCTSDDLDIEYSRFGSLRRAQAEMMPNGTWMKELADKLHGFPVQSTTTTSVMGKEFQSTTELLGVEDRSAPAGFYDAPAGYQATSFDPMAQGRKEGRRR